MKYGRIYNFSAGPATMPEKVLEEVRDEMMNYRGSGMCVMEMSHRSPVYQQIIDDAEKDLCELMSRNAIYNLIFKLVSQRPLAARTINKSVRIPGSVTQIVRMVVKFVVAVFAFAMECRVVCIVACNRIRSYYSRILNPRFALISRLLCLNRCSSGRGCRSRFSIRLGIRRLQ